MSPQGDDADESSSLILASTGAATFKKRIAMFRERKCDNLESNDDATCHAHSEKLDTQSMSERRSTSPPTYCPQMIHDSARECMLDIEPECNGRTPPIPVKEISSSPGGTASDDIWLTSSKSSSPSQQRKSPWVTDDDATGTDAPQLSSLSMAVIDLLPGSMPPTRPSRLASRKSRPLLNSHCGTFVSDLDKNGFWQSLSSNKQQQEAKDCKRPNIVEIMSVGGEDPVEQRILAKILVAGHGFGFCRVTSGECAIEQLKSRYDEGGKESLPILILMDTAQPGTMDGYETTEEIRTLFPDVALPIIMLTASSDLEITTFQRAVEAGANDLVTQPLTKHNLMARIGCQLKSLHFWRGQLESRQNEYLLNQILPKNIISKLKQGHTGCIYDELEEVSVIFTDIVSFTTLSASHPTEDIIHMLDSIFTEFDKLTDKHGLYKVETIGEKTLPAMSLLSRTRCYPYDHGISHDIAVLTRDFSPLIVRICW